jgi:hypothetical protein
VEATRPHAVIATTGIAATDIAPTTNPSCSSSRSSQSVTRTGTTT